MTDEIFFDGARYISAADAAKSSNLTRDYIARLAREGRITGKQVGRQWYVSSAALDAFLVTQEQSSAERRSALILQRLQEYDRSSGSNPSMAAAESAAVSSSSVSGPVAPINMQRKLAEAVLRTGEPAAAKTAPVATPIPSPIAASSFLPNIEFVNKIVAGALALALVVGMYSSQGSLASMFPQLSGGVGSSGEVASAADAVSSIESALQRGVDAIFSPFFGAYFAQGQQQGVVTIEITQKPQQPLVQSQQQFVETVPAAAPTKTVETIVQNPIIEKLVETEPIAVSGGVSESELDQRLQQLNNSVSEEIAIATAANATTIAQNYNVTAQTNAIDQLNGTAITSASISGGSISSASISGGTISGATISGSTFSGTTSLAELDLTTPLAVSSGGTGLTSYTPGDVLYANASGTLSALGIGSNGQVLKISGGLPGWGVDLTGSGGAGAWATSTNSEFIFPSNSTNVVVIGNDATTTTNSILEVSGNTLLRGNATVSATSTASAFVATSTATSTFAGGIALTSGCVSVNGTCLGSGSGTGSSNVSTSSQNTWSALQIFAAGASSTNLSNFGTAYFGGSSTSSFNNAGQLTLANLSNSLLSVNSSGQVVATSTIGNGQLQNSSISINGTAIGLGSSGTITAASSTLLANSNTWTGLNSFSNASTTLLTLGTTWLNGVNNSILSTNANGQIVATSSIGTNNLTGSLGTINGTPFSVGASITVGSASTTLLANSNAFSGNNTFSASTTFSNLINISQSSTSLATLGIAYLPNLTNDILSTNANGQVVATSSIGVNNLTGTLGIGTGGTGTSSAPTYGQLLIGNGSGGYNFVSTSSLGITGGSSFAYLFPSNATSTTITFSSGLLSLASTTIGSGTQASGLTINGGATTTGTAYFAGNVGVGTTTPGSIFSINGVGNFVANGTSTLYQGLNITSGCFSVNGTCITSGSGGGGTSNVSTSTQNTWSALQIFAGNASSSNFSNFGTAYFGGTATTSINSAGQLTLAGLTSSILSTNGTGQVVATTSIGSSLISVPVNSILAGNASGQIIATTSIGTNLLSGTLATINTTPITAGGTFTITAASSTLLADSNTFTGGNLFLASTTIGNGTQAGGLTISGGATTTGNAYFAGNVGIGTNTPFNTLDIVNSSTGASGNAGFGLLASAAAGTFSTSQSFVLNGATSIYNPSATFTPTASQLIAPTFNGFNQTENLTGFTFGNITGNSAKAQVTASAGNFSVTGSPVYSDTVGGGGSGQPHDGLTAYGINATVALTPVNSSSKLRNNLNTAAGYFSNNSSSGISGGSAASYGIDVNNQATFTNNADSIAYGGYFGVTSTASTTYGAMISNVGEFNNGGIDYGLYIQGPSTTYPNDYSLYSAGTAPSYFAGNVGIGTTTPGSVFSVNNILNLTAATSTFYSTGGINISSGCYAVNGTCIGASGSSASSTLLTDSNTFTGNNLFSASTTFSNLININQSSTSLATLGSVYLPNLTNDLLSTNGSGQIVATTSIGSNVITGVLGTINGQSFSRGGTISVGSTTLLADSNTFSGNDTFNNTITGSVSGNAGTATALQTARTINGVSFNGTANIVVASTTLLGDSNAFTGANSFASTTLSGKTLLTNATTTNFGFASLANALLSTNAIGQVVATTSIGTNLLSGNLATINGTPIVANTTNTITAASSTLLANSNTFSGNNLFSASTTFSNLINVANASTSVLSVAGNSYLGIGQASAFSITSLTSCSGGEALQTNGSGGLTCGTIATGGASSGGGWTTDNAGHVTLSTTTYAVAIGASSTPYAKLSVIGSSVSSTTLALVPATSQTANILDIYNTSGALSSVFTAGGNLGLGTTSPSQTLSVNGNALINGSLAQTGGATSTFSGGINIATGCLSINGVCVGSSSASSTLLTDSNTFSGSNLFSASTTFSNLININQSSTSLATLGSVYLPNLTNDLLSTNGSGQIVATTSIGSNVITGVLGTINGQSFSRGGTISVGSTTLLADSNTFSGNDTFNNTITGSVSGNAGTVTNGVYTTTFNGLFDNRLSASSSISGITTLPNLSLPYAQLTGVPSISGYPFALTGNATSTLTQFNGGLTAFASSTIGNGTVAGGLTVNGTATTTNLIVTGGATSTFLGNIGITGNIVPSADNTYELGSPTNEWKDVYIGPGSLYVNGQEVVHTDVGDDVVVTANSNQNLILKSAGSGSLELNSSGTGNIQLAGPTQITGGDAFTTSNGTPVIFTNGTEPGNLELTGNTIQATNTNGGLSISPNGNGGTYFTNGNVGIGTTNPGSKLEVQGTVAAQNFSATSTTATSTFADGINLTGGCFSSGGTCLTLGSFSGILGVGNGGTGWSTITSGTLLTGNGAGSLATTSVGTGLQLSGGSLSTNNIPNSSLQNSTIKVNGTTLTLGDTGDTITAASSTLLANSNTFSGNNLFSASTTFSNLINVNQSSTSLATLGSVYLPNLTNDLLSTNGSGQIVATSSIGVGYLNGVVPVANGGTGSSTLTGILLGNGTGAVQSITNSAGIASAISDETGSGSLVFATSPSFAGVAKFVNASSSVFSNFGTAYFGGTATSSFSSAGQLTLANLASSVLAVNASGQVISTSSIGTNILSGNLATINGTPIVANTTNTITSASSTLLGDSNTFSGNDTFNNTITGSVSGNAGTATALQTARTINGVSFNGTANIVVASTTLLADSSAFTGNNLFSASTTFSNLININQSSTSLATLGSLYLPNQSGLLQGNGTGAVTSVSGTAGQFPYFNGSNTVTATSSLFLATSGNVGIGTTTPGSVFSVNSVLNFGTGTSTLYTNFSAATTSINDLIVTNSSTSTFKDGINISSGCYAINGTCIGGSSASTTLLGDFNTFTGNDTFKVINLSATSSSLLATNASGEVVATTSIGTNLLSGNLTTINGTPIVANTTNTITAASSTLLADSNLFTGTNTFSSLLKLTSGFISGASSTVVGNFTTTGTGTFNTGLSVSGATSTFSNGITVTGGCIFFNGTCLGGSTSSGTVNSGTAGQFAFYNTNGTAVSGTSTLFITPAGNIGVGTTSPAIISGATRYLTLDSNVTNGLSALELSGNTNTSGSAVGRISFNNDAAYGGELARISAVDVNNTDIGALVFSTANLGAPTEVARFDGFGDLGIGTTTPGSILSVAGAANFVNGATSTIYNGLNVSGGCISLNGNCLPTSGASSTLLSDSNTFSGRNVFSLIKLSATSSSLLATDASGNVIATTSIGTNLLSGTLATINTTPITAGGTFTITAASSTLLANSNTFSGNNLFSASTTFSNLININQSSTSLATLGSVYLPNLTNDLLSTNASGQVVSTSSIGVSYLTGILPIANGGTGWANLTAGDVLFGNGTSAIATSSKLFFNSTSGFLGVGTNSPYAQLTVSGGSTGNAFEIDSTASAASTTVLQVSNAGLVSVGDDQGSSSGIFTIDASSSTTTIANLSVGNLLFDTDAGIVNLSDIPVDSNAAAGVQQAQIINIGGNPVLTASGISNGSGGVTNLGVAIGATTTPYATLEVWGPDSVATTQVFQLANSASSTLFTVTDAGNVGIGTTTPGSLLAIAGVANFSTATSTFYSSGGINLTGGGCFSINGTCLTSGGGSSFGYLFPSNATSTTLTFSSGLLSLASTTIGNGTQAGGLTISGGATTTGNAYFGGNIGIGTTTPGSIFSINGVANFSTGTSTLYTNFAAATTSVNDLIVTNSSTSTFKDGINISTGCFSVNGTCVGATSASSTLLADSNTFSGSNIFSSLLKLTSGFISSASSTVVGNFTTTGFINTSGTSGGYKIDGNLVLQASSTLNSIFVGQGAGNAFTNGGSNVALGSNALSALTTGSNNAAVGYDALEFNTTGGQNAAFGSSALLNATSSSNNIAFGYLALEGSGSNISGTQNVAIGDSALQNFSTGSYNLALGGAALLNDTTGSQNFALGNNAMLNSTSTSNNIAIGINALEGSGSNITGGGNVAIGDNALQNFTTGALNVALGGNALLDNTTGFGNFGLGSNALLNNTIGGNNVGIGTTALGNNTNGNNNIGIGENADLSNTTGSNNTAIGTFAYQNATSTGDNTAIGFLALNGSTAGNLTISGNNNVAVGESALSNFISASANTALGFQSQINNKIGNNNTSVGYQSMFFASTTGENTVLGFQAAQGSGSGVAVTGGQNTAVGEFALQNFTTGGNNSVFGHSAGTGITSGYQNVLLGDSAATNLTTGGQNVALGYNINLPSASANGQLDIQNIIFGTGNTGTGSSLSTGNIGIGTTTPGSIFSVNNVLNFGTGTSTLYTNFAAATTSVNDLIVTNSSTSTFKDGINISTGCFSVNGTCLTSGGGSSASSTLLSDSNTFSGSNLFTKQINTSGITGGYAIDGNLVLQASSTLSSIFLGPGAGNSASETGADNTAVGYQSAAGLTSGYSNSAFGYQALHGDTSGAQNTAVGLQALSSNVGAGDNTAIGYLALTSNSGGSGQGTAIGSRALQFNSNAANAVAIGFQAGQGSCCSTYSDTGLTSVGDESGNNVTTGSDYNTFLGYKAGNLVTSGADNVILGADTASPSNTLTTGSNNILIGYGVSATSSSAFNSLNIGNILYGTGVTSGSSASSGVRLGIGTSTPGSIFSINNILNFTTGTSTLYTNFAAATTSLNNLIVTNNSTSTFADGINLTTGCFSVNGTCLSTSGGSSFAYLFPSNATSTTLTFSSGLLSLASTTIGNGTQAGGLTISGGATTTGNAYFGGNVGIGTNSPTYPFSIVTSPGAVSDGAGFGLLSTPALGTITSAGNLTINAASTTYSPSGSFSLSSGGYDLFANATNQQVNLSGLTLGNTTTNRPGNVAEGIGGSFTVTGSPVFNNTLGGRDTAEGIGINASVSLTPVNTAGTNMLTSASGQFSNTSSEIGGLATAYGVNVTNGANLQAANSTVYGGNFLISGNGLQASTTYGIYTGDSQGSQGGNVTYGVYIAGPNVNGTINPNDYSLYSSGTSQSYFAGNVGIGTTTPWGAVAISSSAQQSGSIPLFDVASTTNASLFTVLGNGNVGIGTSTQSSKLTVQGADQSSSNSSLSITDSTGAAMLQVFNNGLSLLKNLLVTASSTIGGGTQATGLTISGGATTTGSSLVQGNATTTGAQNIGGALTVTGTSALNGAFSVTSAATSTFTNGINISGGCVTINGTCIGSGVSGSTGTILSQTIASSSPGSNTSFTIPANTAYIVVQLWGAGGGGGGGGTGDGSAGGTSYFCSTSSCTSSGSAIEYATGGAGGSGSDGSNLGYGGSGTGGTVNLTGGAGQQAVWGVGNAYGGAGGSAPLGGGGGTAAYNTAGGTGAAFGGGGGGGGLSGAASVWVGGGGGAGGYAQKVITNPSGTYYYSIGAGGAGGVTSVSNAYNGGAGGAGGVIIYVYTYNSYNNNGAGVILSKIDTLTSGSGTFTPQSNDAYITVKMVGGGGGGAGGGSTNPVGSAGANTTFGTLTAGGGGGAPSRNGGGGGTASGGDVNIAGTGGGTGQENASGVYGDGGIGGGTPLSGTTPENVAGNAGSSGLANTGAGGSGGDTGGTSQVGGGGGGGGGYIEKTITSLSGSYSYSVGAGGTAGSAGSGGFAAGAGGSGVIYIYEYSTSASLTSGTQGQFAFYNTTGNVETATSTLTLLQSGLLGIGTTTPSANLEVFGVNSGGTQNLLDLTNGASATSSASQINFRALNVSGIATTTGAITSILQQNFNGANGALAFSTLNAGTLTQGFELTSTGRLGVGTTTPDSLLSLYNTTKPSLEYSAGGANQWTEGIDTGNGNIFEIASSTALGTNPRFVINGAGNIGIGTTTPVYQVVVQGGNANSPGLLVTSGSNVSSSINVGTNSVSKGFIGAVATAADYWTNSAVGDLVLRATAGNLDLTTGYSSSGLTLNTSGYVGIGTTSPSSLLTLQGTFADLALQATGGGANKWVLFSNNNTDGSFQIAKSVPSTNTTDFTITSAGNVIVNGTSQLLTGATLNVIGNGSGGGQGDLAMENSNASADKWWTGPDTNGSYVIFDAASAGVYLTYGATSWTANSDERLKTNITSLDATSGLAAIDQLVPITYTWKDVNQSASGLQYGFTAQNVKQVFPTFVTDNGTSTITLADGSTEVIPDTLGVQYTSLIVPTIKALQELNEVFNAVGATTTVPSILSLYQGTSTPAVTIDAFGDLSIGTSTATSTTDQELCLNGSCITNFPFAYSATSTSSQSGQGSITTSTPTFASDFLAALEQTLVQWFASTSNGIGDLYATVIHATTGNFNTVNTDKLCVDKSDGTPVCVTGDQLAAFLAGQTAGAAGSVGGGDTSGSNSESSDAANTPPIISINGNNPATVSVGATYGDLGATITGPSDDLNLGITASVDGAATTTLDQVAIDTSTPGQHTIVYSATDQNGLTGTASRVVNVVAPQTVDASSTAATDTPATPAATSSDATSTTP